MRKQRVKINVDKIPPFVEKFYENPENHEKFKAWQKQREAQNL